MIRRLIVILLLFASLGTLALCVESRAHPRKLRHFSVSANECNEFIVLLMDGMLRVFWFENIQAWRIRNTNLHLLLYFLKSHEGFEPFPVPVIIATRSQLRSSGRDRRSVTSVTLLHWQRPVVGGTPQQQWTGLRFHLWNLSLLFAVYPALVLLRFRKLRLRRMLGLCVACGYNLTGNTTGTCPECGRKIGNHP